MKISILDQRHPEYDEAEIAINRALYRGGKYVRALIETLLPKGAQEPQERYEVRKKLSYYVNHCAGVVDQLVAWLFSAHPTVESDPEDPDTFWQEFQGDCDLEKHSLHQFQASRFREAFITGRAWTLCELPAPKKDKAGNRIEFANQADEDKEGMRRAYLVPLPTEAVIDWEFNDDGELLWAVVKDVRMPRAAPDEERGLRLFTWTVYTPTGWIKYVWKQKKPDALWTKDEETDSQTSGTHSFGVVPLEELRLPEGFYVLGKTADLLTEAYRTRCAKSFGMLLNLNPTPVHKKVQGIDGSDTQISRTRLGPAYGVEIGEKEDLYYLESTGATFAVATEHASELKDELYRIVHQMALSADNSAGAMKRSGDSKAQDQESSEIVLQALSEVDAPSRERKLEMIAEARNEDIDWDVTPVEKFSLQSSGEIIKEGILAGTGGIKSPTFEKERQKKIAHAFLPDAKEETIKEIDEEIDKAVDADPYGMAEVTGGLEAPNGEGDEGGGGDVQPPQGPKTPAAAISAKVQAKMGGQAGGVPQRRGGSQQRASGS